MCAAARTYDKADPLKGVAMRTSQMGNVLRAVGLLVGLAAILALVLHVEPSRLPPLLVKIALYKLAFIAAAALLVAGAIVGRRARNSTTQR